MSEFWSGIYQGILFTPLIEWMAVLTGVLYVIFASREKIICWLFALISSVLYIYICITSQLYIESALQLFYFVMAIVGFLAWQNKHMFRFREEEFTEPKSKQALIRKWSVKAHALNVLVSGVIAVAMGLFFDVYTDQQNPYLDAFTTVYSLAATFMVAQRVLENWVYWIIIDLFSIYLYYSRGLYLSALLFVLFMVLAVFGLVSWYKRYKRQQL